MTLPLPTIKLILREAMFLEVDTLWQWDLHGRFTYSIFSCWKFLPLSRDSYSKITSFWYYQFRIRSGHTSLHSSQGSHSDTCRFGCTDTETMDHLIFSRSHINTERLQLQNKCLDLNLDFNLHSLLSELKLKIIVQKSSFIQLFFQIRMWMSMHA